MVQPILKHIPLDQLRISKLNMRYSRKKPDVSDLLPSIRESGIRQTLLVRQEDDHYGVIAGRRRFFALQQIAAETGKAMLVPCAIMREEDAASAIEASLIENVARLPATEMEQYAAFRRLNEEGRDVPEIAAHFGVTELTVRRVLALADLAAPIRKLYAEDKIDRETVRALTLATPQQQADWLLLWQSEDEYVPHGRACRDWVTGGRTITVDKALFGLEAYDGQVIADLFGEQAVFADVEAFWQAQSAAIEASIEQYLSQGWQDVVCLERGAYFQRWDYTETPKKKGGKVFVEQRHDGTVTFHEGYISQAEARRRDRASKGGDRESPATRRPEMSGPMADYIGLHRHGAAQASLIREPAIAFRLMVAHALAGSSLWTVRPHECTTRKAETRGSLESSRAAAELAIARERVGALFEALDVGEAHSNSDPYRLCEIFAALLAMSDGEVMEVLAFAMAETLQSGGPVVEAVLHVCAADLASYWQPDAAFYDLLRDKRAVNAMVADIGSESLADGCRSDTAKVQKQIIANRIAGEGCAPNPDWRPGWMQVPPVRLVEGAASPPSDAWARIAGLFEAGDADIASGDEPAEEADAA